MSIRPLERIRPRRKDKFRDHFTVGAPSFTAPFNGSGPAPGYPWTVTDSYMTTELVSNPGFETAGATPPAADSWGEAITDGSIALTTTAGEFRSGTKAIKITDITGANKITQAVTVIPGMVYRFTAYGRGDGTNYARWQLRDAGVTDILVNYTFNNSTNFALATADFIAPPSCTSVLIWLYGPGTAGFACWDDVSLLPLEPLMQMNRDAIRNGSFEYWQNGAMAWWTVAGTNGAATQDADPHSGTYSLKLVAGAAVDKEEYQTVTLPPNPLGRRRGWTITYWTKGDATYGGRYGIYDATNAADIVALTATGVTAATWAQQSVSFLQPFGCTSVRIRLMCPSTNTGACWFDDVSMMSEDVGVLSCLGGLATPAWGNPELLSPACIPNSGLTFEWLQYMVTTITSSNGVFRTDGSTSLLNTYFTGGTPVRAGGDGGAPNLPLTPAASLLYRWKVVYLTPTSLALQYRENDVGGWRFLWIKANDTNTPVKFAFYNNSHAFTSDLVTVRQGPVPMPWLVASAPSKTITLGAELNSGALVVGTWYKITATEAAHFYASCAVGDTFRAAATTALDAANKVKAIGGMWDLVGDPGTRNTIVDGNPTITADKTQKGYAWAVDSIANLVAGTGTYLFAYYDRVTGKAYLDKVVAGIPTNLTSATIAYSAAARFHQVTNGASVAIYLGNALVGTVQSAPTGQGYGTQVCDFSTEDTTGTAWSIWRLTTLAQVWSGAVGLATPTLGAEMLIDPGLEANYTAGKCDSLTKVGSPSLAQSADAHGGTKAQEFTGAAADNSIRWDITPVAHQWYQFASWGKRTAGANGTVRGPYMYQTGGGYTFGLITSASYARNVVTGRSPNTNNLNVYPAFETGAGPFDTVIVDDGSAKPIILSSTIAGGIQAPMGQSGVYTGTPTLTGGTQCGAWICLDDITNPRNGLLVYHDGTNVSLWKVVAGVYTAVVAATAAAYAGARQWKVEIQGQVAYLFYNSVYIGSGTVAELGVSLTGLGFYGFSTLDTNNPGTLTLQQEVPA
jgi:hypothetical protein